MEVAIPVNPMDSGAGYFRSAPTSPDRFTELYCGFDEFLISAAGTHHGSSLATVPFAWEDKPGVPKSHFNSFQDDFAFDVSCEFSSDSVWAEDMFEGGVIKPFDPPLEKKKGRERGRERVSSSSSSSSSCSGLHSSRSRRTRSLSPLGSSDYRRQQQPMAIKTKTTLASTCSSPSASSSEKGSRKWSFKDLFLFRSASDGRAMDRDPFKKYYAIFKKHDSEGSGSASKRRERVSAHELHYTMNRAVSNDMKKKTYLPYKQGILGIGI